jgi:hypothetical protein
MKISHYGKITEDFWKIYRGFLENLPRIFGKFTIKINFGKFTILWEYHQREKYSRRGKYSRGAYVTNFCELIFGDSIFVTIFNGVG